MTLGKLLKEILGARKQGEVAAEWLTQWMARGGKEISTDHAESSLSRCMKEKPEGVRFFFSDRARAALLLQILGASDEQSRALFSAADELLTSSGDRAPHVVVDLTTWQGDRAFIERLAVAVEKTILVGSPGMTFAVFVTVEQFRWLPRTFDDRPGLRLEKIASSAEGRERIHALANGSTLVVAPWRFEAFDRWAAIGFENGVVTMSPADALSIYERDGRLPALPAVTHDLATIRGVEADPRPPAVPTAGPPLRELLVALSSTVEEETGGSPGLRLGQARALGIVAAATEREVLEASLEDARDQLGIPCDLSRPRPPTPPSPYEPRESPSGTAVSAEGQATKLREVLDRAARRVIQPTAIRVGDEIHVVTPAGALSESCRGLAHVVLHEVEKRVPALDRVRAAVAEMTIDDLTDDPFLERLIRRIDPDDQDLIPLAHARAMLLRARCMTCAPSATEQDWRATLAAFASVGPPRAALLVRCGGAALLREDLVVRVKIGDLWSLAYVPPAWDLLITRDDTILRVDDESEDRSAPGVVADVDRWQDALEGWLAERGAEGRRRASHSQGFASDSERLPRQSTEVCSPGTCPLRGDWTNLDSMLAGVWLALGRAVRSTEVVEMHDGAVLVHVGAGICLELRCRLKPNGRDEQSVVAAFRVSHYLPKYEREWRWSDATVHVTTNGRGGSDREPGYELPAGFYLSRHGVAVEVAFTFAPWLAGGIGTPALRAASAAIRDDDEAAIEAARRDDDD